MPRLVRSLSFIGYIAPLYHSSKSFTFKSFEGSASRDYRVRMRSCCCGWSRRHSRAPFPSERDCAESQSQKPTKEGFVFVAKEPHRRNSADARGQVFLPLPSDGRGP